MTSPRDFQRVLAGRSFRNLQRLFSRRSVRAGSALRRTRHTGRWTSIGIGNGTAEAKAFARFDQGLNPRSPDLLQAAQKSRVQGHALRLRLDFNVDRQIAQLAQPVSEEPGILRLDVATGRVVDDVGENEIANVLAQRDQVPDLRQLFELVTQLPRLHVKQRHEFQQRRSRLRLLASLILCSTEGALDHAPIWLLGIRRGNAAEMIELQALSALVHPGLGGLSTHAVEAGHRN